MGTTQILRNVYWYYGTYPYMEVPVSTTKLILVLRILYLYYEVYPGLTELILVLLNLFLYLRSYTGVTEHILVLRILCLCYGAYSCTKVPVGTTQVHYTEVPVGTTGLILILQNLYLFYRYGSTRRYCRDFYLYKSTHRYYRTDTEVLVGTFRSLPYSFLYSYSLFRVLSYNCLTTRPIIRNE